MKTYLLLEWINKAIATGFTYQWPDKPGVSQIYRNAIEIMEKKINSNNSIINTFIIG